MEESINTQDFWLIGLTLIGLPGDIFGTWHDFVSLIVQRWSHLPFPSPSRFGHMGTLYINVWVTKVVTKWSKGVTGLELRRKKGREIIASMDFRTCFNGWVSLSMWMMTKKVYYILRWWYLCIIVCNVC